MRIISTKSTAIAAMAYPAPWVNFVSRTTTSTVPHITAPMPLMIRLRTMRLRACGLRSTARWRVQCRTMPIWLSVNETKTPTMYSWMSRVTSAS